MDCETIDPLAADKYSFFVFCFFCFVLCVCVFFFVVVVSLNFQEFFLFGRNVLECACYLFCINRFT